MKSFQRTTIWWQVQRWDVQVLRNQGSIILIYTDILIYWYTDIYRYILIYCTGIRKSKLYYTDCTYAADNADGADDGADGIDVNADNDVGDVDDAYDVDTERSNSAHWATTKTNLWIKVFHSPDKFSKNDFLSFYKQVLKTKTKNEIFSQILVFFHSPDKFFSLGAAAWSWIAGTDGWL